MAYGEVIPPDARADPARFPDEQFPLFCPACDYSLRGLEQGRCPECGREFERGRLLVEQYVVERGWRRWGRTRRYAKWTFILAMVVVVVSQGIITLTLCVVDPAKQGTRGLDTMMWVTSLLFYPAGAAVVLLLVSLVLVIRPAVMSAGSSRAVFAGIDRHHPSYRKAQRLRRSCFVICACVVAAIAFWVIWSTEDWLDYWTSDPVRILVPVGGALAVTAIVYLVKKGSGIFYRRVSAPDDTDERKKDS